MTRFVTIASKHIHLIRMEGVGVEMANSTSSRSDPTVARRKESDREKEKCQLVVIILFVDALL